MRGKWLLASVLLLGPMLGAVVGLGMAQGVQSGDGAAPQALVGTAFTYQGGSTWAAVPTPASAALGFRCMMR